MVIQVLDFLIDENLVVQNQQELSDMIRFAFHKENPSLFQKLIYDDDNIFLEPTLFHYFSGNKNYTNKVSLEQAVYGYISGESKPEQIIIESDKFGMVNLPNIGYLKIEPNSQVNKLQILRKAQEVGLNIPATVITNNKETVVTFLKEHEIIITKPLGEAVFIDYKNVHFLSYTIVLNNSNIREIPETFFPSLFQENIDKKYEIRAFVLGKKIFSMAIFSQNDPKTLQDFRRYNYQNPNRFVPFNLPSQIESKIFCLMDELDLQTGSIDLIKDTTGKYYFLEINPNGQYGMVSKPCNYFLEREIAEYLILNKD